VVNIDKHVQGAGIVEGRVTGDLILISGRGYFIPIAITVGTWHIGGTIIAGEKAYQILAIECVDSSSFPAGTIAIGIGNADKKPNVNTGSVVKFLNA
jgi:hypothetical protein